MAKLTTDKINEILIEYKDYITGVSCRFIDVPTTKRIFAVPVDDLLQEIMIQMFYLLRDRYDDEVGSVERFIKGFLLHTVKGVLSRVATSLKETGYSTNRTQLVEIRKRILSIEQLTEDDRQTDGEAWISAQNNQAFTGWKYNLGILAQASGTDVMDIQLDRDVIIKEIEKKLNPKTFTTFRYVFLFGYSFADTAKITDRHPSTISKQVRGRIIATIKTVLTECGYL